ncbi:MAG TPA: SUF system NifU family Fe-S cluster assembly protein [Chloroflexota bacterium]|nr:SUF system NifU family Fe-S cluster assembly protein [Chloroflexota bacterium]
MSTALEDLYREVILEHYRSPHNRGRVPEPDVANRGRNPLCGDDVEISLSIVGDVVQDVRFTGRGCSISQASASMLTDAVKGKTMAETGQIVNGFKAMMRGESVGSVDLGDLEALGGVRKYPVRVKCALLAWTTFQEGLDNYAAARPE